MSDDKKVASNFDWEVDEKTPIVPSETMEELMETLRLNSVPTSVSDRPTRPISPSAIRKAQGR